MKTARKRAGIENIRTMRSSVNKFRARTPQAALMEIARLALEKERLTKDKEKWEDRIRYIGVRLEEIARMEAWLRNLLEDSNKFAQMKENGQSGRTGKASLIPMEHSEMTIRY